MAKADKKDKQEKPPATALVPVEYQADVAEGIQAYRRGSMILYTVRGEPDLVKELMGELNRRGVNQVVALITHSAAQQDPKPIALKDSSESDAEQPQ